MSFQKSKDISDKCLFQILLLVSIKKKKKLLIDIIHLFLQYSIYLYSLEID